MRPRSAPAYPARQGPAFRTWQVPRVRGSRGDRGGHARRRGRDGPRADLPRARPPPRRDLTEMRPRCSRDAAEIGVRSEAVERRVLTRATWMIAEVSAATSTMMVLFMSSSTVAQFVIFGMIDMEYAAFYGDPRAQNCRTVALISRKCVDEFRPRASRLRRAARRPRRRRPRRARRREGRDGRHQEDGAPVVHCLHPRIYPVRIGARSHRDRPRSAPRSDLPPRDRALTWLWRHRVSSCSARARFSCSTPDSLLSARCAAARAQLPSSTDGPRPHPRSPPAPWPPRRSPSRASTSSLALRWFRSPLLQYTAPFPPSLRAQPPRQL